MSPVYLLEVWWLLKELVEMKKRKRKNKVVATPAATGFLAQMDLGWLECMPPCA